MENEIWKPIKGYEGHYEVSNNGTIKSVSRLAWNGYLWHRIPGCILKERCKPNGYPMVTLWLNGNKNDLSVHSIVCFTFNGPPPADNYEVDHIDGDKHNNNAKNLRWVTHLENMNNPITLNKRVLSQAGKVSVSQFSKTGKLIAIYNSITEASLKTGINIGNIGSCVSGHEKHKTAGGYIWKYTNRDVK